MKVAEDVWLQLHAENIKFGKSWNLFIKWILTLIKDASKQS